MLGELPVPRGVVGWYDGNVGTMVRWLMGVGVVWTFFLCAVIFPIYTVSKGH